MKPLKFILAFDSFKGSADSGEIADSAQKAILDVIPNAEVLKFAVADGGENTALYLAKYLDAVRVSCAVVDPLFSPLMASYYISHNNTAIIDIASASGLPLINPDQRNPLLTSSLGSGLLIADAISKGCRDFIIGIGGSATNDGAMGILSALGYKFLDSDGKPLQPIGKNLILVNNIDSSGADSNLINCHFTLICDVNNPFYGKDGAAFTFASQKGANPDDIIALDNGLRNFAEVIFKTTGIDIAQTPSAGAAGGIAGALFALLGAKLRNGIDTILDLILFDDYLSDSDYIFTGEGQIDAQSAMGKTPHGILLRA